MVVMLSVVRAALATISPALLPLSSLIPSRRARAQSKTLSGSPSVTLFFAIQYRVEEGDGVTRLTKPSPVGAGGTVRPSALVQCLGGFNTD
eukprot:CAMPEP_0198242036 /NCGR_PEP_ID=MMETSP1446-20131203/9321_1 /TAXON_ID=1461542 ORGANISM="Unidentified sp, Strain CCMP2111" /NCGR_SAMPLE_ID=MMETSP1446 /ASSEMBLY_ACC=CAM_ASM_001112 /LENGTH=90 /DNA_ID=CAMNT_0043925173 /DNA_START=1174 /DNA_END=1446 /DNA_ORIENTATION=+